MTRLLVLIALAGCAVEEDAFVEDEQVLDDPDPDGKADGAALVWFTPITKEYFLPSAKVATEARKLFKSAAEWNAFFGAPAPSGIDWSKHWVIFYTPGTQRADLVHTRGWRAKLTRVSLSSTGKTLSITTRLEMNGDCPDRTARPFVTATIPKQTATLKRFYKNDVALDCE